MAERKKIIDELTDEASEFLSAERSSDDEISISSEKIKQRALKDETIRTMLDSVFDMILILDANRQAVHANRSLLKFLNLKDPKPLLGLRLGEIFRCVHLHENVGGCGTTKFCALCGGAQAVDTALKGGKDLRECRIVSDSGYAYDLEVTSSKFSVEEDSFIFFTMRDTSDKKRREALERIFFHDILNLSGAIWGYAEFIKDGKAENAPELGAKIFMATQKLIDEIQYQRSLSRAESGELSTLAEEVHSLDVVKQCAQLYESHEVARMKGIKVDSGSDDVVMITDDTLLRRVISNMLKNALEASGEGDTVTVGCKKYKDHVEFWVHNPTYIPEEVQLQIFNRSFSTKGKGRGLGTYSIKLITENYLKGKVSFETSKEKGTVFRALYSIKGDL